MGLSNAQLNIEMVPVTAVCNKCQKKFQIKDLIFMCPHCDNLDIELISGGELSIHSLEVENPENNWIREENTWTEW